MSAFFIIFNYSCVALLISVLGKNLFFKKNKIATTKIIGISEMGKKNSKNIPATIGEINSLITLVATTATINSRSYCGKTVAMAKPKIIAAKVIGKISPPRQFSRKHQAKNSNFNRAIKIKNPIDFSVQVPTNRCRLC